MYEIKKKKIPCLIYYEKYTKCLILQNDMIFHKDTYLCIKMLKYKFFSLINYRKKHLYRCSTMFIILYKKIFYTNLCDLKKFECCEQHLKNQINEFL